MEDMIGGCCFGDREATPPHSIQAQALVCWVSRFFSPRAAPNLIRRLFCNSHNPPIMLSIDGTPAAHVSSCSIPFFPSVPSFVFHRSPQFVYRK